MTQISRLVFLTKKKTTKESSPDIKAGKISIVIPVRNNQRGIDNYLDNFLKTHSHDNFPREIIIVDNNSDTKTDIKRHLDKGLELKLLTCGKVGPAVARNLGVEKSNGDWIVFNDSDCIPTKSLLTGYIKESNGAIGYAGNVKSLGQDFLSKYYESQEILIPLKTKSDVGEFIPQYLITANTLVWKKTFEKVNGFNETIKIAGGEDIDLGLRLSEQGDLSYAFDSVVFHDFNEGLIGFYKRFDRYGQGNKMIENLWDLNMKPRPFRPNDKTLVNEVLAKLQYLFLLKGYGRQN